MRICERSNANVRTGVPEGSFGMESVAAGSAAGHRRDADADADGERHTNAEAKEGARGSCAGGLGVNDLLDDAFLASVDRGVLALKQEGNTAFVAGKFRNAERLYSDAIGMAESIMAVDEDFAVDPKLYGNRSAARHSLEDYEDALTDAMRALELVLQFHQ